MAIKELETAMAYSRQQFVQTLRDDFLKGAFGEFMCCFSTTARFSFSAFHVKM